MQTYKVVSICGGDRDDGSTATNRRGDGPRVGLVLEGGWELIAPYIDGHRNGCTLQLGNTIIPSKCIILYKRKKMLLLLIQKLLLCKVFVFNQIYNKIASDHLWDINWLWMYSEFLRRGFSWRRSVQCLDPTKTCPTECSLQRSSSWMCCVEPVKYTGQ